MKPARVSELSSVSLNGATTYPVAVSPQSRYYIRASNGQTCITCKSSTRLSSFVGVITQKLHRPGDL
jgi:hypothetical protein